MTNLKAFHGDEAVKEKYLARVRAHQKADELIRGTGWNGSKGCAVGCTLEAYDHARYPTELGIPEWLARVEDRLFEGMNEEKSRTWPEVFLKSIPIGVDLEKARVPFIVMLLEHSIESMHKTKFDREKNPDVVKALEGSEAAVRQMIEAQKSGDQEKISAAESAARSAAESAAESAAAAAAVAAASAAAAASAEQLAAAAAAAAESAEQLAAAAAAAESAAWSAEQLAAAAAAAAAAASAEQLAAAAESAAAFDYYADRLVEILESL